MRTALTATLDALRPTRRRKQKYRNPLPSCPHSSLSTALLEQQCTSHHLAFRLFPQQDMSLCSLSQSFSTVLCPSLVLPSFPTFSIEWIGHATMLIHINGKTILTDPVFAERVGVEVCGKIIGIERYTQPARTLENIPKPDIILLSHAHLDHTDLPTLRRFAARYPEEIQIVTAKNTRDIIDHLAWKAVHELDWEEELWLSGIKIRALETQHNGWRLPWERDRARGYTASGRSYNGYLLEGGGKKIVFGGDTAYIPHFAALRNEGIDVAIMPIGAYQGYEALHCTPEQALQMASEMRAEYFIPMHCATFDQSEEEPEEPLQRLLDAARFHETKIALSAIGERFVFDETGFWSRPRASVATKEHVMQHGVKVSGGGV